MSTYVIGDVQGCFDSLKALVQNLQLDPDRDRLWFVGDLVNRGPKSLEVLRWVRGLGARATVVLGNHDLHLLACAKGLIAPRRRKDTFGDVLAAEDRDELIQWLVQRPLMYRERNWLMVHAGVFPGWSLAKHERLARSLERRLTGDGCDDLLRAWRLPQRTIAGWGTKPDANSATERRAFGLNVFTRMRCIHGNGRLDLSFSGPPEHCPGDSKPWFNSFDGFDAELGKEDSPPARIVFGHWAALGVRDAPAWISLDSGCVWGDALTAYRLEDGAIYRQLAKEQPLARD